MRTVVIALVAAAALSVPAAGTGSDYTLRLQLNRAVRIASGNEHAYVTCARFDEWVCEQLAVPTSSGFGPALMQVVLESTRIGGVTDKGQQGCAALGWPRELARRVWRVPLESALSRKIGRWVRATYPHLDPAYRTLCK